MRYSALLVAASVAFGLLSCGDPEATDEPLFPEDYASSYTEVRNCRTGGEHELNVIRVLANPEALGPYTNRDAPFPVGAVLLKEEYDFSDATCSEGVLRWTVMSRVEDGSAPDLLDWKWQTIDPDRNILNQDQPACAGCHSTCTPEMGGYEGTCTVP